MKTVFLIALMFLLVACAPPAISGAATSTSPGTLNPLATVNTNTSIPQPTRTFLSPTTTTTATVAKMELSATTQTASSCLRLIEPLNGTTFAGGKSVDFNWDHLPRAKYYVILLVNPNGTQERIKTSDTTISQDLKATSRAGSYRWSVLAYDSNNQLICNSTTFILNMLPAAGHSKTPVRLPTATNTVIAPPTFPPTVGLPTGTNTAIAPPTFPATPPPEPTVIAPDPPEPTEPPPPEPTVIAPDPPEPTEPAPTEPQVVESLP